jgi:D-alanyl-D-alanine carboxypeptidase
VKAQILDRVGMANTSFPTTSAIPAPVLHSYTNERGNYEEATFWSASDFPNNGSVVTTLDDLGKWTRALGTGSLLWKRSYHLQVGDQNVGLGPLTELTHYGVGVIISHDWIYTNPQCDGYTGVIGYLPAKKATVVVAGTFTPKGDISVHYGAAVFNRIAEILSPRECAEPHRVSAGLLRYRAGASSEATIQALFAVRRVARTERGRGVPEARWVS